MWISFALCHFLIYRLSWTVSRCTRHSLLTTARPVSPSRRTATCWRRTCATSQCLCGCADTCLTVFTDITAVYSEFTENINTLYDKQTATMKPP
jgi:hypothetical protein